ncbi:zinc dependent phospholipase C family protein [Paenibacillus tarimensis]
MPNIWTHFIFGEHVLFALGEQALIGNPDTRRMFNMGCQGPDFLFYHHYLPWKKSKAMNQLGSAMHSRHCGKVIMDLLDAAGGRYSAESAPDPAVIYTLGFVLHHVLDRNMHPYVFSRSGFRKWDHQRFEVIMDTLITRKLLGIETWRTPVWKEIRIDALPPAVVEAFERVTAGHYPELAPLIQSGDWNRACRDMIQAQRLFHDPTGVRRLLTFGQIEPLVYKKEVPALDVMNEQRTPWVDPTNKDIVYDYSVWMMWDTALEEGSRIIAAILDWFRSLNADDGNTAQLRKEIVHLIGNRSYETGLPCDMNAEIRYAEPIWMA